MDDDLVVGGAVEDQIGVRVDDDPAKAALARELACVRMHGNEVDDRLNSRLHVAGALLRTLVNKGQNVIELVGRANRVT